MRPYRVVVAKRADRQIQDIDAWWIINRRDAPDLFLEELNAALRRLGENPMTGILLSVARPRYVRRVLLPKSGYHVYFTVDKRRSEVRVRAVWFAARGGQPRLV